MSYRICTYATVQAKLKNYYHETGLMLSMREAFADLKDSESDLVEKLPPRPDILSWDLKDPGDLLDIFSATPLSVQMVRADQRHRDHPEISKKHPMKDMMVYFNMADHKPELANKKTIVIYYAMKGGARFCDSEGEYKMSCGDLILVGTDYAHDMVSEEDGVILGIQLRTDTFRQMFHQFMETEGFLSFYVDRCLNQKRQSVFWFHLPPSLEIKLIIRSLLQEFHPDLPEQIDICRNYVEILLYKVQQACPKDLTEAKNSADTARNHKLVFADIMNEIYIHASELTLQQLAEKFHYSPSYLSKLIKNQTGKNFQDIVIETRIGSARHLLRETDMEIGAIAEKLGYAKAGIFSRQFHQITGQTPREYRKCQKMLITEQIK